MKMRSTKSEIIIDGIEEVTDFGELAKLAIKLRMEATIELEDEGDAYRIVLRRWPEQEEHGLDEVTNIFLLWCFVEGIAGRIGLSRLEQQVRIRHFPLDRAIQDVMEIGGGPDHDGHDHP